MPAITLQPLNLVTTANLENADVSMQIEQATGFMRSMLFKDRNVDLFQQVRQNLPGYVGGLRIYDERDEIWYSDLNDAFTLSDFAANADRISFKKQFKGAPFELTVTMKMEGDAFHWEVEAVKANPSVSDRSLRVYFFLPLLAGWEVWAPAYDAQFSFDGMSSFEYMYVQIPYVSNKEVILPMISHYSPDLNVGFSMLEPIDAPVPAAKFQFANGEKCFNWGAMKKDIRAVPMLEAVNYYIGLTGDRPMRTKIMLMFHEGDWRPAVGKVFNRWKEYFVPHSDTIYKYEGVFTCEGIQTADELQRCKDFGIKTLEVHGHFEHYCDYFQDGKDSWITLNTKESYYHKKCRTKNIHEVAKLFDAHTDEELAKKLGAPLDLVKNERTDLKHRLTRLETLRGGYGMYMDAWLVQKYFEEHSDEQVAADLGIELRNVRHRRDDVKARLNKLAEAGIGLYWYFNYTDGFRPIVEARWPDSIAKNEDGSCQPSGWHMCHNMNVDPRYSFGKFTIESARKIFETYPMLNGFFLDCFRHFEIDFAHDDGVTVVNNKPAYSMNFSYDAIQEYIRKNILKDTRSTFANKPQSIRSMHYADGVLLEGDGNIHEEKFFWACIAKPLFFMWTSNKQPTDVNLRRSIYAGSFPKYASEAKKSYEENKAVFQKYLPLCAQFPRRVLCFEPDPLRVPSGSRGRLYTVGDDYVAGIVSDLGGPDDTIVYHKTPHAVFRVARGHDISKVGVMVPGDKQFRSVDFKFDGTMIFVPLDGYKNCAVVRLFVTQKTGKPIGANRFQRSVDYCGDPESAFCDRNER
jgi:hypothetical protein